MRKTESDGTAIRRLVNSRDEFWAERMKATGPRLKILDLLKETYESVSAEFIQQKIGTHLATVYRTLNHLLRMEIIIKIIPTEDTYRKSPGKRKKWLYALKPNHH